MIKFLHEAQKSIFVAFMMGKWTNFLLYFYKNPQLGKVKSRLATSIGAEKALEVYKYLSAYVRDRTSGLEARKIVYYSNSILEDDIWEKQVYQKRLQEGADLGERMSNAINQTFRDFGPLASVGIIGTDLYPLNPDFIAEAFTKLKTNDVVIGPAVDGGYYYIGMRRFHPELFVDIPWSSEFVFSATMEVCIRKGLSVHTLPVVRDIDTLEDLKASGLDSAHALKK